LNEHGEERHEGQSQGGYVVWESEKSASHAMLSSMKRYLWMRYSVFCVVLALLGACSHTQQGHSSSNPFKVGDKEAVLILYVSDLHSYLRPDAEGRGGYAQLATWIQHEKKKAGPKTDVWVLGGGDLVGKGSLPCQITNDKECAPLLGALGLDYATLGNYELYNAPAPLRALFESSGVRWLGMNVQPERGVAPWTQELVRLEGARSGISFWLGTWADNFDVRGYKIRAFPSQSDWALWKRKMGTEPLLWMTHQEQVKDQALMKETCLNLASQNGTQNQVLALLKSNDHRIFQQDTSHCAPIIEPGPFGRYASKTLLTRNAENPQKLDVHNEFVEIKGLKKDAQIAEKIKALYQKHAPDADTVLFKLDEEVSRESIAQWVADSYRHVTRGDAAVVNIGFVKDALEAGPVTREEFLLTLPHNNELFGLDWSQADMQKALCAASRRARDVDLDWGSDLHFSGIELLHAGTDKCQLKTSRRGAVKLVVDSFMLSRSARWLGKDISRQVFRFGVDSRRVLDLSIQRGNVPQPIHSAQP
jgi:hypothetical protein